MTDEELDKLSEEEIQNLMKLSNELSQRAYDYVKMASRSRKNFTEEIRKLKDENYQKH